MCSFESVTDRFLTELGPMAAGLVPKDADPRYEYIVKGLKHVQVKVCLHRYLELFPPIIHLMCLRSGLQKHSRRELSSSRPCQSLSRMHMAIV